MEASSSAEAPASTGAQSAYRLKLTGFTERHSADDFNEEIIEKCNIGGATVDPRMAHPALTCTLFFQSQEDLLAAQTRLDGIQVLSASKLSAKVPGVQPSSAKAAAGPAAPLADGGAAAAADKQAEKQYCDQAEAFLLEQPGRACPLPTLGQFVKNPYKNGKEPAKKTGGAILNSDARGRFLTTNGFVSLKPVTPADVAGVEVATDESGRDEKVVAQAGGGLANVSKVPGKGKVGRG